MKSLMVGAMLLHCMHAQVVAPVVTSGINTPSESDLAIGSPDVITPLSDRPNLPTGTSGLVLDDSTPVAPFGGGSTPGTGIRFDLEGVKILKAGSVGANTFVFPSQRPALADATPAAHRIALSSTPADLVVLADSTTPVVIADPTPVDGASGVVVGTPVVVSSTSATDTVVAPADTAPVVAPVDTPVVAPVDTAPVVAPVETTPVVVAPIESTPAPDSVSSDSSVVPSSASTGLVDADPVSATTSPTSTPVAGGSLALPLGSNPYFGPFPPDSPYDPNSPYYDPTAQPPGWEGDDSGIYDGEDNDAYPGQDAEAYPGHDDNAYPGHDDNEECPAWCLPDDDAYPTPAADYYPTSTPDYDYSPYQPAPTPEDSDYETAAEPYPGYEATPAYTPDPKAYPAPSHAADRYQQEPYPKADPAPSYAADPYQQEPYPTPTPDYEAAPQYYPTPAAQKYPDANQNYPQLKKVRSILRAVRRQFNWPQSAAYPQPQYSDDDSDEYDGEDGSIPDWLYDISGAPSRPTYSPKPKPKCPKSCYKPKPSAPGYAPKPVKTYTYTRKGGYKTAQSPYQPTEEPYYPKPTKDAYYGDETTDAPYAGYTSSAYYPAGNNSAVYWPTGPTSIPDEPTSIPDMPTSVSDEPTSIPDEPTSVPPVAPSEPTTLATYYQPAESSPQQTGGGSSDPGSPAGDYTGDTLDTICPGTCNPFNPTENFCDITTGCTTTGGSKYYCACRAGFRADGYNAKDFSKQFKVAGQPYVYLAVSTSCNTPCSDQTCSEVLERSQCK